MRRKRTIATAIIIVVATSLFGSMRKTPTFAASCEVLVSGVGFDITEQKASSLEVYSTINTLKSVIEGPMMAGRVAARMKKPIGVVQGRVNASLKPATTIYLLQTVDTNQTFVAQL